MKRHIERIDASDLPEIVALLTTLAERQTPASIAALVQRQGWTIAAQIDGEVIIADGPWAGTTDEITISFDGLVTDIMIAIVTAGVEDDDAIAAAIDAFADTVVAATTAWGEPAGRILGDRPRAWWVLAQGTVAASRWKASVALTWHTHEFHDCVLQSIKESV